LGGLQTLALSVNAEIRSRVTYSVLLNRLPWSDPAIVTNTDTSGNLVEFLPHNLAEQLLKRLVLMHCVCPKSIIDHRLVISPALGFGLRLTV
jgi:hypothetical protein